jgi:hypothetical protein
LHSRQILFGKTKSAITNCFAVQFSFVNSVCKTESLIISFCLASLCIYALTKIWLLLAYFFCDCDYKHNFSLFSSYRKQTFSNPGSFIVGQGFSLFGSVLAILAQNLRKITINFTRRINRINDSNIYLPR